MRRRSGSFVGVVLVLALLTPVPGAAAPPEMIVTIYQDSFGVPHVAAASREAAAYGAGYVVGRDRLFQTDVIRRLAQGRLSEILGAGSNDANLRADMAMRREFYDRADVERQYELLPDEIKGLLRAYADGFNLALAEQTANPAEASVLFAALGYVPEPWRPQDSAAVLLLFTMVSFAGEGAGGELANAELLATLVDGHDGDIESALAVWQDLLVRNDPDASAVIPHGEEPAGGAPFISASEPAPEQVALALSPGVGVAAAAEADMLATLREVLTGLPVPRIGSYAIAATGERTKTGSGLLLGAPQAGMFAPSVFYELGIHAPGMDCTGMTVPGLGPFIGIGWCNDHAWTLVAGNAGDQVDLMVHELCDPTSYVHEGACVAMDERTETYVVKSTLDLAAGRLPRLETDTVYSTVYGPVFHLDESQGRAYVFRRAQAGHFVQTFEGTYGLNVARSLDDVEEVAARITATYNLTYADRAGNIAYRFTGWQPVRHEAIDHRLPVPGDGRFDWQDRTLPFDRMPYVTNPSTGFLVVNQGADSKPVSWWPRPSGRFIGRWGHTAADQNTLAPETGMDIDRLKQINRHIISDADTVTPLLDHLISEALSGIDPISEPGRAYALYRAWRDAGYPRLDADGDGWLDDPAVAIFGSDGLGFRRSSLWDRFVAAVWAPSGHQPRGSMVGQLGQTMAAIDSPELFDGDYATGWQQRFRDALDATLQELADAHGGAPMEQWRSPAPQIRFSEIGLLKPEPVAVVDHGSYSLIVDLGADRGVSIQPPGNGRADRAQDIARFELTGEFPPHFADQLELYRNFDFKRMNMRPADYLADARSVVVLPYPVP